MMSCTWIALTGWIRQIGHHSADLLEHAANVGPSFGANFFQRTDCRQLRHDGVSAFFDWHFGLLLVADEGDLAGRNPPLLDIALRRLNDDSAARPHQRAGNGNDPLGLLGIEVKNCGNVVGIAELLDRVSGIGDFDRRRHAHRHTINEPDFVDDRNRLLQAVVDEDAIVLLDDCPGNGQPRAWRH